MFEALGLAAFGAVWRRWLGGWKPFNLDLPRAVKYSVFTLLAPALWYLGLDPIRAALVTGWLGFMFSKEHGNWMDIGTMPLATDKGYLDGLLQKLPLRPGSTLYDFIGLTIHYSLATGGVALITEQPYYFLCGIVVALGYLIFSFLKPKLNSFVDAWTAYAELILGAVLIGGTAMVL